MAGRGARKGGRRPHRGLPDGGQPGRLRREDCRSQGQDRIGLRSLRRDARRPARGVAHGAFRAGHKGRPYLGARCRRRQGAAVDARQGIRGDVRHGEPALQREIHARRRGGDRLAEPLQVLRTEQKNAQGGYNIGVGHLDDLDADPVDHLRPARAGLYGGRGDGPRQRPPLGAVRRRRGQPGQRVDAPRGTARGQGRPRDDPRVLRRRARTDACRAQGVQQGPVQPRGL